jgi:hypothetical protein
LRGYQSCRGPFRENKCKLRKKSENSLPAPPAFSNDSLRSTGKIEKLKCKLAENQERLQKLEEELKQTRKQLKVCECFKSYVVKASRVVVQGQRRTVRIVTLEDMRNQLKVGEDSGSNWIMI